MGCLGDTYRKKILALIEKATEDLTGLFLSLNGGDQPEQEEMRALLLAKKSMMDFSDDLQQIFENLVALKYLNFKNGNLSADENKDAFHELFEQLQ